MAITDPPLDLLPDTRLIIGAERIGASTGGEHEHRYPATGKATASLPLAGAEEMDAAVRAARGALPAWRATPIDQRRDSLFRLVRLVEENAATLSRLVTIENGTPALIANEMPRMCREHFAYYAGWADKVGGEVITQWGTPAFDYTVDEPFGVVAVIIPWNGPLVSIAQILAPALAAGNVVVCKPSELAPYTALFVGALFLEAGFPPGVVNVLPGGAAGGEALVRHPGVDKIHFTGSGSTARRIIHAAAEHLTPLGLELGGKSAVVVFDDADLGGAVMHGVGSVISLSGQACVLGTRFLVQSGIYDAFVEQVAAAVGFLQPGDPFEPATFMGPVISEPAVERILGVIERASSEARLVAGGRRMDGDLADGYFIEPTIFAEVDNASDLAQNEVFGPVLAIARFDTEEEAIALANDTAYGLGAYVHTDNLCRAHRMAASLDAGTVFVNGFMGVPANIPFGGNKRSGYGRIGGKAGLDEFLRPKNVWIRMEDHPR